MERKITFAVQTLLFYGLDMLERMLKNTGPYVDKIYLSYSKVPWEAYNKTAREKYMSEIEPGFIDSLPYREKIVWLEGVWTSEDNQRNHCLEHARSDGIDYLIIQDVDEFYMPQDFLANLAGIVEHPDFPVYKCPWTVFWKTMNNVIQVREHEGNNSVTVTACPNFAVNVKYPGVKFDNRRLVNQMDNSFTLKGLCLHLAWVLSDEEVLQKIQTWGHSHQFDYMKWYLQKWLAWEPGTQYIGHITRANYLCAVPYKGSLPNELNNLPQKKQIKIRLSLIEKIDCLIRDYISLTRVKITRAVKSLRQTKD